MGENLAANSHGIPDRCIMECKQWEITKFYNTFFQEESSQLYQLHQKLDCLVLEAYQFTSKDDILEKLLELNRELIAKDNNGETVIGLWNPHRQNLKADSGES